MRRKIFHYPTLVGWEGSWYLYKVVEDVNVGRVEKNVTFRDIFNELATLNQCLCCFFESTGFYACR